MGKLEPPWPQLKETTKNYKNGNNQKLKLKSIGCMGELEQPGNSRE